MPDHILSIFSSSTSKYPRFQIADPQQRFWTGESWTEEESEGQLFACVNDAAQAIQEILLVEHGHRPLRRLVAPVYLNLHSDKELSLDQISDWLVRVARLTIDTETHGNGPIAETLGLCHIDWSQLREIKSPGN